MDLIINAAYLIVENIFLMLILACIFMYVLPLLEFLSSSSLNYGKYQSLQPKAAHRTLGEMKSMNVT